MKPPRLHLRDLFWLLLVIGILCAWWVDHRDLSVPSVSIANTSRDFGTVDPGAIQIVRFEVKNTGKVPLLLTGGQASNRLSHKAGETVVPAQQSRTFTVTWSVPAEAAGSQYSGTVQLHTNDPRRPRIDLTVSGRVE
jgi:hypothetical protein